jgi:hypothetical protein
MPVPLLIFLGWGSILSVPLALSTAESAHRSNEVILRECEPREEYRISADGHYIEQLHSCPDHSTEWPLVDQIWE